MAWSYRKTRGAEARPGYVGHMLTERRNGLVADVLLTLAGGTAELRLSRTLHSARIRRRFRLSGVQLS